MKAGDKRKVVMCTLDKCDEPATPVSAYCASHIAVFYARANVSAHISDYYKCEEKK